MYHHIAHLDSFAPNVTVGSRIKRGDLIGYCGKTGTGSPHCHYEVMYQKPEKWTGYTWGMTKATVQKLYLDPTEYLVDNLPMKWNHLGYDYLSPIVSSDGRKGYHPGKDLNWGSGADDFKFPVFATCDGIIEYMGTYPHDGSWGNNIWWKEEVSPSMKYDNMLIQETEVSGTFALVYGGKKHIVTEMRSGLAALTAYKRKMESADLTKDVFDAIPTGENF